MPYRGSHIQDLNVALEGSVSADERGGRWGAVRRRALLGIFRPDLPSHKDCI